MASSSSSSLAQFEVQRRHPELLTPGKPTPHELKPLSDIDDQHSLRFQLPIIQFYRYNVSMDGKDPVKMIRNAIRQALVYYYPLAGRLRELPKGKLAVDCTGEGVMFIEADANVRLDQLGDPLQPPFPWLEELLYKAPGYGDILHNPLMLIQVTRLICGGFVFALCFNHTIFDATGLSQFMNAVAEMARGASTPSVYPTWQRELLNDRDPPRITCAHREYDVLLDVEDKSSDLNNVMMERSFFFGPQEIKALKKHLPSHLRTCSRFEIITACLWRCRTKALRLNPKDEVRLIFIVNARKRYHPPLPEGFYGNALAFPVVLTTAGKLCQSPISYTLELLKKVKATVTNEYMRSLADLMVTTGRPKLGFVMARTFLVSDNTQAAFKEVNFGWGEAVYGGVAEGGMQPVIGVINFYVSFRIGKGVDGILVPMFLPRAAMERFEMEVQSMIMGQPSPSSIRNKL